MWLLIDRTSGEMIGAATAAEPTAFDKAKAYAVQTVFGFPDRMRWSASRRSFVDVTTEKWTGSAWVDDPAKVEAQLLVAIDAEREARQMIVLTTGGAKKYVYNRKANEAYDARALLPTVLNALGLADRKKRFPFAAAEAALTGETISAVLTRFDAGMTAAATENARIEAVAMKAKREVRAATTAAAKRAVVAAVNWSWAG